MATTTKINIEGASDIKTQAQYREWIATHPEYNNSNYIIYINAQTGLNVYQKEETEEQVPTSDSKVATDNSVITEEDLVAWLNNKDNAKYISNEYYTKVTSNGLEVYKNGDTENYDGYTTQTFLEYKNSATGAQTTHKNLDMSTMGVYSKIVSAIETDISNSTTSIENLVKKRGTYTVQELNSEVSDAITTIKQNHQEEIATLDDSEQKILDALLKTKANEQVSLLREKLKKQGLEEKEQEITGVDSSTSDSKKTNNKNASVSEYRNKNVSYSGVDMVVTAQLCMGNTKSEYMTMGSLQTISYSVYDRMEPIHSLGNINAKDYVHTHRYIAGSMVFAVFDQHWCKEFIESYMKTAGISSSEKILTDEIPPMNLTISMGNEYGCSSRIALYSVRLFNEGMTMSVNDIYTEHTYQFVALNIDYLENVETPAETGASQNLNISSVDDSTAVNTQQINKSGDTTDTPDADSDSDDNSDDPKQDDNTQEETKAIIGGNDAAYYYNLAAAKTGNLDEILQNALKDIDKAYEKELALLNATMDKEIENGDTTKVDAENARIQLKENLKAIKAQLRAYIEEAKKASSV